MAKPEEAARPAQVPGEAESPAQGKTDRTVKDAIRHTDKTEPAKSSRDEPERQS